jgi:hypothetical protein
MFFELTTCQEEETPVEVEDMKDMQEDIEFFQSNATGSAVIGSFLSILQQLQQYGGIRNFRKWLLPLERAVLERREWISKKQLHPMARILSIFTQVSRWKLFPRSSVLAYFMRALAGMILHMNTGLYKSIDEGYEALERLLTEVHKKIPREEEEEEEEEDESMEEVQKEMEDLDIREGSDEGEE